MSGIGTRDEFSVVSTSLYKDTVVEVLEGDLLRYPVDVMVNAANINLRGGAGVDGAIQRAAGPELLEEMKLRFRHPGKVGGAYGTTGSFRIEACRYIIHAVGPDWRNAAERDAGLLGNAYRNSLDLAAENKLRSISFPAISVGIYSMPGSIAGPEILRTIRAWIDGNEGAMDRISILLKGFLKEDIDELQFRWLGAYIQNQGSETMNDPPAAFRRPVIRPVRPAVTTTSAPPPVKSKTLTAPQPPPRTTTVSAPVPPRKHTTGPSTSGLGAPGPSAPPRTRTAITSPVTERFIADLQDPPGPDESDSSEGPTPPESPPGPSTPSESPTERPNTPPASPPPAPFESDDDEPPYLFNFYEPLSHMWMGRDRYYGMLEAGLDPDTFVEGMIIPDPEDDSDEESLPREAKAEFARYHAERIARGREISEHLALAAERDFHPPSEAEVARDTAARVRELRDTVEAQVKAAKEAQTQQCTFYYDRSRCPVMCNPRIMRLRKFPGRCRTHQVPY
ncbi:hypothetical protein DSL72_001094 [Monilinia vaccinii-corymbosi]|uniref:Macro domain-containing protein n=1 Tax=Monilinia vaccinii-corymbosi TaxID=61207 RepID=A0A8A3PAI1_9HELO|nr:hypothetical protein DSL72_001094 [Monilinia vaccinii-corymbosi]